MSETQRNSTRAAAQATELAFDATRGERPEVRADAASLRAESRRPRRHAAEPGGEGNALLDAVVVMVTDVLQRHGFELLAPVGAKLRMVGNGSTGVELAVRLQDPSHADAAKAAIVESFPDPISEINVS